MCININTSIARFQSYYELILSKINDKLYSRRWLKSIGPNFRYRVK